MAHIKKVFILGFSAIIMAALFQNCSDPTAAGSGEVSSNTRNVSQDQYDSSARLDRTLIDELDLTIGGPAIVDIPQAELDQNVITITGYYRDHLGREPDDLGMNYWLEAMAANGLSLSQVETHIMNSSEANIRGSYLDHLGREPDSAGMEYYLEQFASGTLSLSQIDTVLMNSIEANIRQYYLDHMDREPDTAGMEFWRGQVEQGSQTLDEVKQALRSSEGANGCKTDCL